MYNYIYIYMYTNIFYTVCLLFTYIMKQASLLGVEGPTHSVSNTLCTCETHEWAICMHCVVRWVSQ